MAPSPACRRRRPKFAAGKFRLHIPISEYSFPRMQLNAFKNRLLQEPDKIVRFVLPDGEVIPARFHVTEVGHVTRRFIDCGSTVRETESCLLQTWVPDGDNEHRLTAGKLAEILEASRKVLPARDLEIEVEYDSSVVAQYTVNEPTVQEDTLTFALGNKKTDCLARETCGVEPAAAVAGCCGGQGCGCG